MVNIDININPMNSKINPRIHIINPKINLINHNINIINPWNVNTKFNILNI